MNKSSNSYAKSLFEAIKNEAKIDESLHIVLEDLLLFSTSIEISEKSFQNPLLPEEIKYETLASLFPNMAKLSHSLLKILLEKREIFLLPYIYQEVQKLAKEYFAIKNVKLITSSFLDRDLSQKVLEKLRIVTKAKEIILDIEYKEDLLSGLIIESDSWALDESSLEEFKSLLKEV